MTQITLWTCRAHYPGGSERVPLGFFPVRAAFPVMQAGRHPRFTFEACSSFTRLQPVQLLTHLKWALSRGPSPDSYLSKPPVSYRAQPSVTRVGPSPTGHLRLWGALHRILCTVNEAALTTYNIGRTQTETIKWKLKKNVATEAHRTATRTISVHYLGSTKL
jgi:hypothetical protein